MNNLSCKASIIYPCRSPLSLVAPGEDINVNSKSPYASNLSPIMDLSPWNRLPLFIFYVSCSLLLVLAPLHNFPRVLYCVQHIFPLVITDNCHDTFHFPYPKLLQYPTLSIACINTKFWHTSGICRSPLKTRGYHTLTCIVISPTPTILV